MKIKTNKLEWLGRPNMNVPAAGGSDCNVLREILETQWVTKNYMPKKYVENPPTPQKNCWSRNYDSFDCMQNLRAIRANSNFPKSIFFLQICLLTFSASRSDSNIKRFTNQIFEFLFHSQNMDPQRRSRNLFFSYCVLPNS